MGRKSYGPKLGPVNWAQTQKAMMGGRKLKRSEDGQQVVNINKACLVGSGPAPSGPSPNTVAEGPEET